MRAAIADEQHMAPSVIPPWRTLAPPTEPFPLPTRMTVFRLTPEQRETLLHAWARATDRARVERLFLPAAEAVLDVYFHIEVALMTRPSEVRQTIELLRDKVRAARVALRAVATNAGATEVLEFHAKDLPRQELPLPVEILLDYDPDSAAYPARALGNGLDAYADTVERIAEAALASLPRQKGEPDLPQRYLIRGFANAWWATLGNAPRSGNDSNFVKFCALVSAVAGVTLSRDVIRRVLSPTASANRTPAGS